MTNSVRYQEALLEFDNAIRIDPNDASVYINKGNALDKLGPISRTLLEFDNAIRIDPNNANAYYNKGNALDKLGLYQDFYRI